MTVRSADFKSAASTDFAIRAALTHYKKGPLTRALFFLEAGVGIEPAYADLQSAA